MNQYHMIPEVRQDEYMNLQIESWRARVKLLKAVKPIVKAYDGKAYSKRFDKAVSEQLNTEDHDNRVFVSHSYGDRLYITVCTKRSIKVPHDFYTGSYQINDTESCVNLATITPENAKLRKIDADTTIKNIDSKIEELHERIENTLRAYANLTAYRKKIEEVKRILQEASELIGQAPREFTGLYKTEYCLKESRY